MNDDVPQTPDPDWVPPTIEVSTMEIATLAGLLIDAQEYLDTLSRVAMFESRPRPKCAGQVHLVRDVLIQWSRENVVSAKDCLCVDTSGGSLWRGCPVHSEEGGAR